MFEWINHESNSSWISLKCFQVSNSCLMDLGCPLLLGSSDRRLRRRAATLPHFRCFFLFLVIFPYSFFFRTILTEASCLLVPTFFYSELISLSVLLFQIPCSHVILFVFLSFYKLDDGVSHSLFLSHLFFHFSFRVAVGRTTMWSFFLSGY